MEYKPQKTPVSRTWIKTVLVAGILCMTLSPLSADTYRWKDKDGKVHYGATVPAEYADQPYDVLNKTGIVIEHVEDTSISMDIVEEEKDKKKGRQPLISKEERQIQSDKLLVVQYGSEEEIIRALNLEISQLGYDSKIIEQSFDSTMHTIRDQIRLLSDQQRSNQPVNKEQQKEIAGLYERQLRDSKRRVSLEKREARIRARFEKDLERYRFLTSGDTEINAEEAEQG
jgi:hypothetical protein